MVVIKPQRGVMFIACSKIDSQAASAAASDHADVPLLTQLAIFRGVVTINMTLLTELRF